MINRKARCDHAQTISRSRQRGVLPGGSGHRSGPDTLVVDGLAAARSRAAVLGTYTCARGDTARRRIDRAGSGVCTFRGGRPRDTGTDRRTRATGRRRLYRYVCNPMYVAILGVIVGQALLLGQLGLLLYAAALWLISAAFVRWYEEPTLKRRFGAEYE